MLGQLKGNKGYFATLVLEALTSSVVAGITLGLVNLPIGLAAAAIDFGATMAGGIAMGPKTKALSQTHSSISTEELPQEKSLFRKGKDLTKKIVDYYFSSIKDPEYLVGFSAATAGISALFQSALTIEALLTKGTIDLWLFTVSSLPVGLAAAGVLGAAGLVSVIAGNIDKGRGLSKYYHKAFKKKVPETAPKNSQKGFLKSAFERSGLKKLVNNSITKNLIRGLLILMTVESGLFTVAASIGIVATQVAGMLASAPILSNLPRVGLATGWGIQASWRLISAGRLTVKSWFHKKPKSTKTAKTAEQDPAPAATPQPTPGMAPAPKTDTVQISVATVFEDAAAKNAAAPANNNTPQDKPATQPQKQSIPKNQ